MNAGPDKPEDQTAVAPGDAPNLRIDAVLRLSVFAMAALLGVVLLRVGQLQAFPSDSLQHHIHDRVTREAQPAARGDIADRRGRVLAATRMGWRVFVDPVEFKPPYGESIKSLAAALGTDEAVITDRLIGRISDSQARIEAGGTAIRYVVVSSVLSDTQLAAVRRLKIPGVHLEQKSVRELPGGPAAAGLGGLVNVDHRGLLGAELAFDEEMTPEAGHLDYVRDARGKPMWVEASGYQPPSPGQSVRLSIDLHLQQITEEEIERGVKDADAVGGRAVMIDPLTGEVLAMADYLRDVRGLADPPARAAKGSKGAVAVEEGRRYKTVRPDPGRRIHPSLARNRCVEDLYEPGSTFKAFMWSVVTERGLARPDEVFDTHEGSWVTDYGRSVRDVTPKEYLTWADVLVYSSNIGMVQGTARLSHRQMRDDVLRFGFGRPTGIGLPGESAGMVTPVTRWSKYTQTSVASGYEVGVTPLQMVRAFACFARTGDLAGTMPTLTLRAAERAAAGESVRCRVLPTWVAELARETMKKVARIMEERSRARFTDEPPLLYSMFGKSGTAEIVRPDGRGYFKGQHNSSFLAAAPADAPRVVLVVVIDDPGPELVRQRMHYGSAVAGPVVRRIVRRSLEYLGVPPEQHEPLQGGDAAALRD